MLFPFMFLGFLISKKKEITFAERTKGNVTTNGEKEQRRRRKKKKKPGIDYQPTHQQKNDTLVAERRLPEPCHPTARSSSKQVLIYSVIIYGTVRDGRKEERKEDRKKKHLTIVFLRIAVLSLFFFLVRSSLSYDSFLRIVCCCFRS